MANKIKYDVPHLYAFLYKNIKENYKSPYLKISEFLEVLKRTYRVQKILYYPILYEMEQYKLLKRINIRRIRVLKSDCHLKLNKLRIVDFWN